MFGGGDVADERHHGVGNSEIVGRRIWQTLDFAHDVVAEVPDNATVQRRQLRDDRRAVAIEDAFENGEHTPVGRDPSRELTIYVDVAVAGHDRCRWSPTNEREPAPPTAVVDGFEQKAGLVADDP